MKHKRDPREEQKSFKTLAWFVVAAFILDVVAIAIAFGDPVVELARPSVFVVTRLSLSLFTFILDLEFKITKALEAFRRIALVVSRRRRV